MLSFSIFFLHVHIDVLQRLETLTQITTYSFHNMMNHIISGIFAGNAVIGKVSEYTSWSAINYYDNIVKQALIVNGHNPDLVATITGFGPSGSLLCSHPLVNKIIFTGSPAIGKKVMETASKFLKPVILELGGKDAMVLMDDIKLNSVIPWVLRGCYQNCGQNCVGVERVLVYESIYDSFITSIVPRVQQIRQGIPVSNNLDVNDIDCGSMVTLAQINLIEELIDDAVQHGAKILIGGKKPTTTTGCGQFYPPTVLIDVTTTMRIYQEEVFGPVMTIIKVPKDNDDIAIQMINNSNFGLGFSVYSNNQQRAINLGRQIQSGMCVVNDFGSNYLIQTLPFGGVKESGFGRFAGIEGLRALCVQRSILIDRFSSIIRTSIPPVIDYPINKQKGLPFVVSLTKFFYSERLIEKVKGIIGLIKFGS
jgi:acyl-CoA reductase-like NAD-dependent aldehyde dehydrogenase